MKRILLMDDEKIVLEFLSRMLEHIGYEVGTSTDGSQAISTYLQAKADAKPFDVVMMDLVVAGGMGGPEAVLELKRIDPQARVIATSGHLDHPVMLDHVKFGFDGSIEKPYKIEKLKKVIEAATNAPA